MAKHQEQCCANIRGSGWYRHTCSRRAAVQADGKLYCRQHSPEAAAKRKAEQRARWDAEAAASKARRIRAHQLEAAHEHARKALAYIAELEEGPESVRVARVALEKYPK